MISNNYVRLRQLHGKEEISFIPEVEFEIPEGEYVNLNYATIKQGDNTIILTAGEKVNISNPKPKKLSKSDLKELLISRGIPFPTGATIKELQEIANATL